MIIIVIIIVAGGLSAIYLRPSTSSSITTSTTSSSTTTSSSITTSTTSSAPSTPSTLAIDDWVWPAYDLNELYAFTEGTWPNWLEYTVYQPLVWVNETAEYQHGSIEYTPALAANWTVSANATLYTFNLRNDVHFSNGDPFNAYQVWMQMYGFYYLTDNSSSWLDGYTIFDMNNSEFGPATIALINQSGLINPNSQALAIMQNSSWPIYVTGPYQIVFHLESPFLFLPGQFIGYEGLIFDSNWVLQHGGFGTPTAINSYFNQNAIPGSGPYEVSGIAEQNYIQFTQDPNYWGNNLSQSEINSNPYFDSGHVKNVIVYYKSNDLTRYTDLASGTVQIANIQQANWNLVTSNPEFSYVTTPYGLQAAALALNTLAYPTNITDVRQAIVHAINYTELEQIYNGPPYVGPSLPLYGGYYDPGNIPPYVFNTTLAEQYLSKANITNFPTLDMTTYSGCGTCTEATQIIQADLAAIGITVNIEVQTDATYYAAYGSYQYELSNPSLIGQISLISGGAGFATADLDPAGMWVALVSCTALAENWAIYCNPVVQKAVDAFTSSSNVTYIQSMEKQAETQIYNDAPYGWIGTLGLLGSAGGSLVWQKDVISGFLLDPLMTGQNTIPIFNTVTFG